MGKPQPESPVQEILEKVLGYLNFSSGQHDPKFFSNLDSIFRHCDALTASKESSLSTGDHANPTTALVDRVAQLLRQRLNHLKESNDTFRDSVQAENILNLVFEDFLPAWLLHHRDLFYHQNRDSLFNSFLTARVIETVAAQASQSDSPHEIISNSIASLNDHIGHRPVATLTSQKIEPYVNEWVRPIPIYVKGAGVCFGKYETLARIAVEVLYATDAEILRAAQFDPDHLEELAIDPRSFDFDHPVNKRPNHHFGTWDEHIVDNRGYYTRFIVHQVTLDSLLQRIDELKSNDDYDQDQLMFEAAAALAGTMLMGSGISGGAPGAYDSNTSLGSLLPTIAGYRDSFYSSLAKQIRPKHQQHLEKESQIKKQIFGGVRQHLNAQLASRRAYQLVNCRLASIFARMGFPAAAKEQSELVPVASARIICQIDCLLSEANRAIKNGQLSEALKRIPEVKQLLKRGIQCGAIVDPWNIIGFDGNYSLFPAIENSVRDHRAYELVDLVECIMAICSKLWSEAAAQDQEEISMQIREEFSALIDWWRPFAAHEVMSMDAVDGRDIFQAAELVAKALRLWHQGGAETGDISFWAGHADLFDSPKAYTLVVDSLIHRKDYSTAMALLIHWLSQASVIGLQQADSSFHNLAFRWVVEQKKLLLANGSSLDEDKSEAEKSDADQSSETIWNRIAKFYDFIEANADQYWEVPDFTLDRLASGSSRAEDLVTEIDQQDFDGEDEDEETSLFSAAYENVTFSDSADDGNEGEIYDTRGSSDEALEAEADRVMDRLEFLGTVASYWRIAATIPLPIDRENGPPELSPGDKQHLQKKRQTVSSWLDQAKRNFEKLTTLGETISRYKIPRNGVDQDSMLQYDQNRLYKESLTDQAILTCVETENAMRTLEAVVRAIDILLNPQDNLVDRLTEYDDSGTDSDSSSPQALIETYAGILLKDNDRILAVFDELKDYFNERTTLYVPLSKGGRPNSIVDARVTQTALLDLMRSFPAIGLLTPTFELSQTALDMERNQPPLPGAVTEFDEMFEIAFTSMVESVVASTEQYEVYLSGTDRPEKEVIAQKESVLFDCVEMLTESMLILWLKHSQTLRLSVMEKVHKKAAMDELVKFITEYGGDLFTQNFLHVGNIRAILHQGVGDWLGQVQESHNPPDIALFRDLGTKLPMKIAVRYLTLVLEGVLENFNEYRDYNTTTTQSDDGALLHIFFQFLILRSRHDRVCWNLNPVVWAHRILVRRQQSSVARMWRKSLKMRVGSEAQRYVESLNELRREYSIQMNSIGRRVEGRFGSEMQIDRLTALVKPAMAEDASAEKAFNLLHQEAKAFSRTTLGVGVDLPAWLAALENEVQQRLLPVRLRTHQTSQHWGQKRVLPVADLREQLEELPRRNPDQR